MPGLRADTEGGWLVCSVDGFHLRREDGDPMLAHQGPIPMISEEEPDRGMPMCKELLKILTFPK